MIDRELFREDLHLQALRVPRSQCANYLKLVRKCVRKQCRALSSTTRPTQSCCRHIIDRPRVKPVQLEQGSDDVRLVVLGEDCQAGAPLAGAKIHRGYRCWLSCCNFCAGLTDLPEAIAVQLRKAGIQAVPHVLSLAYENCTGAQALKVGPFFCCSTGRSVHKRSSPLCMQRLLPPDVEAPSAFETIGHIAHLNLRAEQLPWKHVIGQVACRSCSAACVLQPYPVSEVTVDLTYVPTGPGGQESNHSHGCEQGAASACSCKLAVRAVFKRAAPGAGGQHRERVQGGPAGGPGRAALPGDRGPPARRHLSPQLRPGRAPCTACTARTSCPGLLAWQGCAC